MRLKPEPTAPEEPDVMDVRAELGARTPPQRALVVEDAPEFRDLVAEQLAADGFDVEAAGDGLAAVQAARAHEPDVIVLDLGLPGMDGIEACRQIRTFSDAYVMMLTGRDEEVDMLVGLSVGADDYMTKPFSPRELVARIHAMLRRPRSDGASPKRHFGELMIDAATREVRMRGVPVELTRIEFDLLDVLSSRPKVVFTRAQLIDRVWGEGWYGDGHLVDVHISTLRKKIGDDPRSRRYIRTVRGVGYRLVDGPEL